MAANLAFADVVVVASVNSPINSLSKEQSSDIFLGKTTSYTPLDQPESSPLREEFYSKVTGKSASQAKSYWSTFPREDLVKIIQHFWARC